MIEKYLQKIYFFQIEGFYSPVQCGTDFKLYRSTERVKYL